MTDDPTCWHSWWRGDPVDSSLCQCKLLYRHEGPHRCCCGATDD